MKKILALDGGGMKGLITAAFLDNPPKGFPALSEFDLLAGTSTGGILALGIRAGLSTRAMVNFYLDYGPKIFPGGPRRVRLFKKARYSARGIEGALRDVFGPRRLDGADRPAVFIPALDFKASPRQDAGFFFTEASPYTYFDAARATSAAPSYFPAYPLDTRLLWDGGLAMNNPAMGALAHARGLWPDADIEVWSVGTGREPAQKIRYPFTTLAMLDDVVEVATQGAAGIAHKELSLDRSIGYIRYDFNLQECYPLDTVDPDTFAIFIMIGNWYGVKRIDTR